MTKFEQRIADMAAEKAMWDDFHASMTDTMRLCFYLRAALWYVGPNRIWKL